MAATIITDIYNVMFTSELAEFLFRPDRTETAFALRKSDGTTVLETVYYPDLKGVVTVYGLNSLLEDNIADDTTPVFSIYLDGAEAASFTAIRCPIAVELPARTFLYSRFLTSVIKERDTAVGRHECLSAYNPEGVALDVTARYLCYDGSVAIKRFSGIAPTDRAGDIVYYNVSPICFNDFTIGELIGFTASCGARTQRYRVLMAPPHHDPAIIFRNLFGCWETIFMCGKKETDAQFTRSGAMINGKFLNYDLAEVMTYKASTGPLRDGTDRLARDFARSPAIFLLKLDGTPGDRLTITDSDVKTDNADDTISAFSFTYRKASLLSTDFEAPELYRIFDNTFDLSYE